jgi:ABC-type nitrate/sulfonate/bicarbonate transport system substrate-binding protein
VAKWIVETTAGDAAFRSELVYFPAADYLPDIFTTTKKYYDAHKDNLVKFLVAMQRANADVARDIDAAVAITAKYLPTVKSADPADAKDGRDRSFSLPDGRFDYAAYERALPLPEPGSSGRTLGLQAAEILSSSSRTWCRAAPR